MFIRNDAKVSSSERLCKVKIFQTETHLRIHPMVKTVMTSEYMYLTGDDIPELVVAVVSLVLRISDVGAEAEVLICTIELSVREKKSRLISRLAISTCTRGSNLRNKNQNNLVTKPSLSVNLALLKDCLTITNLR